MRQSRTPFIEILVNGRVTEFLLLQRETRLSVCKLLLFGRGIIDDRENWQAAITIETRLV